MDMVILIIETTKRSRCEEVSKGQLKWAVSKPKMNVKATSPQLDEGDKSKGRLRWWRQKPSLGQGTPSRLFAANQTQAQQAAEAPSRSSDSTSAFIHGIVTLSPLSVKIRAQELKCRKVKCNTIKTVTI